MVEDDDPRTAGRPTIARASATLNLLLVSMATMLREMIIHQMHDWAPTRPGSNTHTPAETLIDKSSTSVLCGGKDNDLRRIPAEPARGIFRLCKALRCYDMHTYKETYSRYKHRVAYPFEI